MTPFTGTDRYRSHVSFIETESQRPHLISWDWQVKSYISIKIDKQIGHASFTGTEAERPHLLQQHIDATHPSLWLTGTNPDPKTRFYLKCMYFSSGLSSLTLSSFANMPSAWQRILISGTWSLDCSILESLASTLSSPSTTCVINHGQWVIKSYRYH